MKRVFPQFSLVIVACATIGLVAPLSRAQLRETEVLVVYDSRVPDSLAVAEYYAGSAKVPGGAGGVIGKHPAVLVVNLATLPPAGSAGLPSPPNVLGIDYPTFVSQFRNPLRAYLSANTTTQPIRPLAQQVRSIVLTKGIPHRILNIGVSGDPNQPPDIGDNPGAFNNAFNTGNYKNFTYASVDAELALLWQDLSSGEAGGWADSRADGFILNPGWRVNLPSASWPRGKVTQARTFLTPSVAAYCGATAYDGLEWFNQPVVSTCNPSPTPNANALTTGDIYLVCRLDGNSLAAVKGMIDRAQNLVVPMSTATLILDKDAMLFGTCPNCGTLDNLGPPEVNSGSVTTHTLGDFDLAYSDLIGDGRFLAANTILNTQDGLAGFIVGPNSTYTNPPFITVSQPVILLASFGANHTGVFGTPQSTTYGTTFNLLPGAIFNSVESYNGRQYEGLGQAGAQQQQTADFLAAGGTFAIGNVWEPISWTAADNQPIVRAFLLGNQSWAEAAYSALPALSWQQIVLGDPLARVRRDREDVNGDGGTNIDDLYAWYQSPVNLNNAGSADATDYRLLEASVRANELVNMKGDRW